MKSRNRICSDEDDFRAAMSDVQPLKPDNRIVHQVPRPSPLPEQRRRDEESVMQELLQPIDDPAGLETGEELLFLRPGYSQRLLRRLRRGHFSIADSIDLHQMTEAVAREVLRGFLEEAGRRGYGCVRIVHGKGLRSRGLPKLKLMTNIVLRKHAPVIAFASCRPVDGGTGAVNVLLKNIKPNIAPV
jgi:DNA-nicking Smr family endonuclease